MDRADLFPEQCVIFEDIHQHSVFVVSASVVPVARVHARTITAGVPEVVDDAVEPVDGFQFVTDSFLAHVLSGRINYLVHEDMGMEAAVVHLLS